MAESHIEHRLAETFGSIDRVEGVYVIPGANTLGVFTIIDEDDEDTYDQVYEGERLLIRQFGNFGFDFNVIARRGRSIAEIVGSRRPIWQRSESTSACLKDTST